MSKQATREHLVRVGLEILRTVGYIDAGVNQFRYRAPQVLAALCKNDEWPSPLRRVAKGTRPDSSMECWLGDQGPTA